jgi:hypothetical protein
VAFHGPGWLSQDADHVVCAFYESRDSRRAPIEKHHVTKEARNSNSKEQAPNNDSK